MIEVRGYYCCCSKILFKRKFRVKAKVRRWGQPSISKNLKADYGVGLQWHNAANINGNSH